MHRSRLTKRCSERLPAALRRFPMIKHFDFDWCSLPVAVADLILVRPHERLPVLLSAVTAMFLTLACWRRGREALIRLWSGTHTPAWWQSEILADFGWWMATPSSNCAAAKSSAAFAVSLMLTIVLVSLFVFYVTRASVRHAKGLTKTLQPTPSRLISSPSMIKYCKR